MKLFERLWSKTIKQRSCLVWTGCLEHGYACFNVPKNGSEGKLRQVRAARWIYKKIIGPIPDGFVILHSCDNRACVALQHLEVGTQLQNVKDCIQKGRFAYANRMPHYKLTDDQVREIKRLRIEHGISQSRLGELFGVSQTLISLILLGKRRRHAD